MIIFIYFICFIYKDYQRQIPRRFTLVSDKDLRQFVKVVDHYKFFQPEFGRRQYHKYKKFIKTGNLCSLKRLALQKYPPALHSMGELYEIGFPPNLIERNLTKAFEYFKKAADLGYPESFSSLAFYLRYGLNHLNSNDNETNEKGNLNDEESLLLSSIYSTIGNEKYSVRSMLTLSNDYYVKFIRPKSYRSAIDILLKLSTGFCSCIERGDCSQTRVSKLSFVRNVDFNIDFNFNFPFFKLEKIKNVFNRVTYKEDGDNDNDDNDGNGDKRKSENGVVIENKNKINKRNNKKRNNNKNSKIFIADNKNQDDKKNININIDVDNNKKVDNSKTKDKDKDNKDKDKDNKDKDNKDNNKNNNKSNNKNDSNYKNAHFKKENEKAKSKTNSKENQIKNEHKVVFVNTKHFSHRDLFERKYEVIRYQALQGDPESVFQLGNLFYSAPEIRNLSKAFELFSEIEHCDPRAVSFIGRMYQLGQHFQKDNKKAKEMYKRSLGEVNSIAGLGLIEMEKRKKNDYNYENNNEYNYEYNFGNKNENNNDNNDNSNNENNFNNKDVNKNDKEESLFNKDKNSNNIIKENYHKEIKNDGENDDEKEDNKEEYKEKAEKYLEMAADMGHFGAIFNLASIHYARNKTQGLLEFLKLADANFMLAQLSVASILVNQEKKSLRYLRSLIQNGIWNSMSETAESLFNSNRIEEALLIWLELGDMGMKVAALNAGLILFQLKESDPHVFNWSEKKRLLVALRMFKISNKNEWVAKTYLRMNKTEKCLDFAKRITKEGKIGKKAEIFIDLMLLNKIQRCLKCLFGNLTIASSKNHYTSFIYGVEIYLVFFHDLFHFWKLESWKKENVIWKLKQFKEPVVILTILAVFICFVNKRIEMLIIEADNEIDEEEKEEN